MGEDSGVVILGGVRTAIGAFGGALRDVPPARSGATVAAEAIRIAQVLGVPSHP